MTTSKHKGSDSLDVLRSILMPCAHTNYSYRNHGGTKYCVDCGVTLDSAAVNLRLSKLPDSSRSQGGAMTARRLILASTLLDLAEPSYLGLAMRYAVNAAPAVDCCTCRHGEFTTANGAGTKPLGTPLVHCDKVEFVDYWHDGDFGCVCWEAAE